MRPESQHCPSSNTKQFSRLKVAGSIGVDLETPIVDMRARLSIVFWASVPETTVYEYGDLDARENQVSAAS
jgi:hypothetical protein